MSNHTLSKLLFNKDFHVLPQHLQSHAPDRHETAKPLRLETGKPAKDGVSLTGLLLQLVGQQGIEP